MNWRKLTKIYTVLFSPFATLLLFYMIITAYLNGNWKVVLNFNAVGEGIYELIMIPAWLVVTASGAYWYIEDLME